MPARKDDLSRKDTPSQRTKGGLTIPVPTRGAFFGPLEKAAPPAKKRPAKRGGK